MVPFVYVKASDERSVKSSKLLYLFTCIWYPPALTKIICDHVMGCAVDRAHTLLWVKHVCAQQYRIGRSSNIYTCPDTYVLHSRPYIETPQLLSSSQELSQPYASTLITKPTSS